MGTEDVDEAVKDHVGARDGTAEGAVTAGGREREQGRARTKCATAEWAARVP